MSEKIADIHESINRQDRTWIRKQIADVYANSNSDLNDLKKSIISTTQGADEIMEKKFTMDHVKNVLKKTVDLILQKGHTEAFREQGAGLTLSLQIALSQLGYNPGPLDGVYRGSNQIKTKTESKTMTAVKDFQEQWNNGNTNDQITVDGRAGKETLTRILNKLESLPKSKTPEPSIEEQEKSEKLLEEIGTQYILPQGERTAEKIDKIGTTPSKVILKSNIGGKTVEIEFGETDEDLSGFNPNFKLDFGLKTRYYNPTLISGKDSFDLQEKILGKGPTAKTIITLIPKKEETKPVKKIEKSDKPVIITPEEKPDEDNESTETGGLTGKELEEENYDGLKENLWGMETDISIEDNEKVYGEMTLEDIRKETRTKIFCFDGSDINKQTMIEQMLAPVIIATGDMPKESVKNIIDSRENNYSGSVSYSIKDIAETLNIILREENPDNKYINTTYFKQFCKYLLDKKIIEFKNGKYIDNDRDEKDFINVLFTTSGGNGPKIKVGEEEFRVATDIQHELHHAYFETVIVKDENKLNELRNYFYDTNNLDTVKNFLKAIYSSEDLPYNWHFDSDGSTSQKRLDFINSLTSGEQLKEKGEKDIYPTGNPPEFNLLTEFWAYAREQDPTVNLGGYEFSWEKEGYVAPEASVENNENQEILNTINTKYKIDGNHNDNINLNDIEHLTNGDILVKGKIGEKDLDIIFDSDYSNPRLQINQKQYNLYEFDRNEKKQLFVVPNSVEIVEDLLSYRNNLTIKKDLRDYNIGNGKFDFSKPEKITIVFENGTRIDFDNEANLKPNQNNIKIDNSDDTYTASLENGDQPAKIVLTKNVMSNQTNQQSIPEVISFIDNFKENNNKDKEKFAEIMENLPEELRENLLNFINEIKNNGFIVEGGIVGTTNNITYGGISLKSTNGLSPHKYLSIKNKNEYNNLFSGLDSLKHLNFKDILSGRFIKEILIKIN